MVHRSLLVVINHTFHDLDFFHHLLRVEEVRLAHLLLDLSRGNLFGVGVVVASFLLLVAIELSLVEIADDPRRGESREVGSDLIQNQDFG